MCAILWLMQRYVLVFSDVVPCCGGSRWRECRGWSSSGWSGGGGTPAAAASAAQRKAALDAGIIVHLAQKKVIGGIAPVHLLEDICARTD